MNRDSIPLTFYPSIIKNRMLLIVSMLFTLIGVWMISDGEFIGWVLSIFFSIGCMTFVATLLPNSSYLRISKEGLEVRSLFRSIFVNWSEVSQFKYGYVGRTKMISFNYRPEHKKYETLNEIAKTITGVEGALPDTYGKPGEELANLLNEWKEKFSKA